MPESILETCQKIGIKTTSYKKPRERYKFRPILCVLRMNKIDEHIYKTPSRERCFRRYKVRTQKGEDYIEKRFIEPFSFSL